jgi:hypothetical protein
MAATVSVGQHLFAGVGYGLLPSHGIEIALDGQGGINSMSFCPQK